MPTLTIQGQGVQEQHTLEGNSVTLGRGVESDIPVRDLRVSRRHCQILRTAEGFKVVNVSEGNGTYVNGVQVQDQILKSGDRIQIGSTVIVFDAAAAAASAPATSAPSAAPSPTSRATQRPATARIGTQKPTPGKMAPTPASAARPAPAASPTSKGTRPPTQRITTSAAAAAGATAKPTTRQVQKPGTTRMTTAGTGPQKTGTTGRFTTRRATTATQMGRATTIRGQASTATQRFMAQAGQKRMPVIIKIGIVAGVLVLGILVLVLTQSDPKGPDPVKRFDKYVSDGAVARGERRYDDARKFFKEALDLARSKDSKDWEIRAAGAENSLKEIDEIERAEAGLQEEIVKIEQEFRTEGVDNAALHQRVDRLLKSPSLTADQRSKMESIRSQLAQIVNSQTSDAIYEEWNNTTKEVEGLMKGGKYSEALKTLDGFFQKNTANSTVNRKADNLRSRLNSEASTELYKVKDRVDRGQSVDLDELRSARERFAGTEALVGLEELIKQVEAKQ